MSYLGYELRSLKKISFEQKMIDTKPIKKDIKEAIYNDRTRYITKTDIESLSMIDLLKLLTNMGLLINLLRISGIYTSDTLPQFTKSNMVIVLSNFIFTCSPSIFANMYNIMYGENLVFGQFRSLDNYEMTETEYDLMHCIIFNIRALILYMFRTNNNFPEALCLLLETMDLGLAFRGINDYTETVVASVVCDVESHLCEPFSCLSRFLTRGHWMNHIITCLDFNNPDIDSDDMIIFYYSEYTGIIDRLDILPSVLVNIITGYSRTDELTLGLFSELYELIYKGRVL